MAAVTAKLCACGRELALCSKCLAELERQKPINYDLAIDVVALVDKGAFILAAVEGGAKASEASRVYRAIVATITQRQQS
jgi:hypothetical protein